MNKEKRKQSREEQLNKLFSIGADTNENATNIFAKRSLEECGIYHNRDQVGTAQLAPGQNRFDEDNHTEEDDDNHTEEDDNEIPFL